MPEKHASRFATAIAIVIAAFVLRSARIGGASEGSPALVELPPPMQAGLKFMLLGDDFDLRGNTFEAKEIHGRWIQATCLAALGPAEVGAEYWLNIPAWRGVRFLPEKPELEPERPHQPR